MTAATNRVHLEWGVSGAQRLGPAVDVAAVVDVLSFTTTVGVACERGITVLPYRHDYETAQRFADDHAATLAGRRREQHDPDSSTITLSPRSVRACIRPPERLVLPSPNGSTISHRLGMTRRTVVAASLRNADAVGAWLIEQHPGSAIAVVAAGERWDDDSLRPAVEDLWGAGGVLDALVRRGRTDLSPEAWAAVFAWRGVGSDVSAAIHDTVSGRELHTIGFADDVQIAGEVDTSTTVPTLVGGTYVAANCGRRPVTRRT